MVKRSLFRSVLSLFSFTLSFTHSIPLKKPNSENTTNDGSGRKTRRLLSGDTRNPTGPSGTDEAATGETTDGMTDERTGEMIEGTTDEPPTRPPNDPDPDPPTEGIESDFSAPVEGPSVLLPSWTGAPRARTEGGSGSEASRWTRLPRTIGGTGRRLERTEKLVRRRRTRRACVDVQP